VRPFRNALILKFRAQKLNLIKMKPEDTNTAPQSPRTMAELALARNWFAGRPSSTQDRYLMGQVPSKGWTPGPEDFKLLQEMFSQRDPRPRKR
jgi:hypothetical protein